LESNHFREIAEPVRRIGHRPASARQFGERNAAAKNPADFRRDVTLAG
jgi:hypothetical protein